MKKQNVILPILMSFMLTSCIIQAPQGPIKSENNSSSTKLETSNTSNTSIESQTSSESSESSYTTPSFSDEDKLHIWASAKEKPIIDKILDEYNREHPNKYLPYKVTIVEPNESADQVMRNPSSRYAPDLFLTRGSFISDLCESRVANRIGEPYVNKIMMEATDTAIDGSTCNNQVYGFPISEINNNVLYYKKSIFSGHESKLETLDDLINYATRLNKSIYFNVSNAYTLSGLFISPDVCGTDSITYTFNLDGIPRYTMNWDNQAAAEMLSAMSNKLAPSYNNGTILPKENIPMDTYLGSGQLIAAIEGSWNYDNMKARFGDDLGVAPLPAFQYGETNSLHEMGGFIDSLDYCINARINSSKKRMAFIAASLLGGKYAQSLRYKEYGAIPCNYDLLSSLEYINNMTPVASCLEHDRLNLTNMGNRVEDLFWFSMGTITNQMKTPNMTSQDWQEILASSFSRLKR